MGSDSGDRSLPAEPPSRIPCCASMGICCCCSQNDNVNGSFVRENRHCTDGFCLLFFLLCLVALGIVWGVASIDGNVWRVIYGTDYAGNLCGDASVDASGYILGSDPWTERRTLWYPLDPGSITTVISSASSSTGLTVSDSMKLGVCVKTCPSFNTSFEMSLPLSLSDMLAVPIVDTYINTSTYPQVSYPVWYDSTPFFHRCVPKSLVSASNAVSTAGSYSAGKITELTSSIGLNDFVVKGVQELIDSWQVIVLCMPIAFVLSLLWFLVLYLITIPLVIFTLVLLQCILVGAGLICWFQYRDLQTGAQTAATAFFESTSDINWEKLFYALAIIFWILSCIYFFFFVFMIRRMVIAARLVRVALHLVAKSPTLFLIPIIKFIFVMALVAAHIYLAVLIYSINNFSGTSSFLSNASNSTLANYTGINTTSNSSGFFSTSFSLQNLTEAGFPPHWTPQEAYNKVSPIADFGLSQLSKLNISVVEPNNAKRAMNVFNLFMFLWNLGYINAFAFNIIAMYTCMWFWSAPAGREKHSPVCGLRAFHAWWWVFYYHQGTIAFGSLVIAIVQFTRILLKYITEKVDKLKSDYIGRIAACIQCILACLEGIIRWVNLNAYVMVCIKGQMFCTAACTSLALIVQNLLQVAAITFVAQAIFAIAKLCILGTTGVIAWYMMGTTEFAVAVKYRVIPLIPILLGCYVIASVFVNIADSVVTTLRLAYLVDCQDMEKYGFCYRPKELEGWFEDHTYKPASAKVVPEGEPPQAVEMKTITVNGKKDDSCD